MEGRTYFGEFLDTDREGRVDDDDMGRLAISKEGTRFAVEGGKLGLERFKDFLFPI